jgi:phosphoadenosine phosphosulfate reductase
MHNIIWDTEINGILLTEKNSSINPPRPVYFEELDILGLDNHWEYPKSTEPLLWAIGRRYFYNGKFVAKTKGGQIYQSPKVIITKEGKDLKLKPINIKKVIEKNKDFLFVLENETMDFIEFIYKKYRNEGYNYAVSFSGGKDSHAMLDLVTRVLPHDEFQVIFSDTTLENSYTYKNVKKTIEKYHEKHPEIQFLISKPSKTALDYFSDFGLPSRFHRWCTPVLKTAPFNNLIKKNLNENAKIVVFEGVRAEESHRRSTYERIAGGVKHFSIINARPILYWNFTEVILYNFYRNLDLNLSYRYGLSRVGCSLCPNSSEWSEFILKEMEKNIFDDYVPIISEYANKRGLKDKTSVARFISSGQWKKRAGGRGLNNTSSINFLESDSHIKAVIINPKENFIEWSKVLGSTLTRSNGNNKLLGEININESVYSFEITKKPNKEIIRVHTNGNIQIRNKLKRILYKTAFCVHCGVCEAECSTGSLKIENNVKINSYICNQCENCLYHTVKGCLVSKSVDEGVGGYSMRNKTRGIDRYSTFGMREEWLNEFLSFEDNWLDDNILGPKQIKAMINWLSDSKLIDAKNKRFTNTGRYLKQIHNNDPSFVWSIIWNNLYYDSAVINWYCDEIDWNSVVTKNDLKENIGVFYSKLSKGTLSNAIDAMVNTFDRSPIGNILRIGILEKKGRIVKSIRKYGTDQINPFIIAYSLYKLGEYYERYDFTVSELYDKNCAGGPYKIFGISQNQLERILRGLQEDKDQLLKVDLNADLDNISLREDLSSEKILKIASERV